MCAGLQECGTAWWDLLGSGGGMVGPAQERAYNEHYDVTAEMRWHGSVSMWATLDTRSCHMYHHTTRYSRHLRCGHAGLMTRRTVQTRRPSARGDCRPRLPWLEHHLFGLWHQVRPCCVSAQCSGISRSVPSGTAPYLKWCGKSVPLPVRMSEKNRNKRPRRETLSQDLKQ